MNGGRGERERSFSLTSATTKGWFSTSDLRAMAVAPSPISAFLPSTLFSSATKAGGSSAASSALKTQYSTATKAWRSFSRSTMRRRATDCTRPAEMPLLTFFHRSGESL